MTKTNRKIAMCLMAHPDDCEILAAGTLSLLHERGWQIHIATMTPGDCGSFELPPEEIASVRRHEAAEAADVIGAAYHCLEERDLRITFSRLTIERTLELMRRVAPSLVITHSLTDYMVDHEVTAQLARTATFGYAMPNAASTPVAAGSAVPYLYYADAVEGIDPLGRPVTPSICVDITEEMQTKTSMLRCHASQRDWLLQHHGVDEYTLSMQQWGEYRGKLVGVRYAEGYRQHLGHAYPRECILSAELGALVHRVDQHH